MAAVAFFVAALVRDELFRALFLLAPLLRAPPDFLAEDFLPPLVRLRLDFRADDFRADDLRADLRVDDFLADFRRADFRAEDLRADPARPPDLREREPLPPLLFRPPDFFDVAMKRLRK